MKDIKDWVIFDAGKYSLDPLGFVLWAFPWGVKGGPLEKFDGPDSWQAEDLDRLGEALRNGEMTVADVIRLAVAAGNGVGKSAFVAWIILWAMATFEDCRGVVTANTENQLRTKTWAELSKWHQMSIIREWFVVTATAIYSKNPAHERTWRIDQIPWSETKPEAFAGLHNQGKRVILIFDEACHDEQTEVLTGEGWKFFQDLRGDELFLSMDPETREAEYVSATTIHKSYREGEMLSYDNRGLDFKVTPNHRMFNCTTDGHNKGKKNVFKFDEISSFPGNSQRYIPRNFKWNRPDIEYFVIPEFDSKRKSFEQIRVNFDLWMEFLGWYCSEGSLLWQRQADGSIAYNGIAITQSDVKTMNGIFSICEKLGFNPKLYKSTTTPQIHIHKRSIAEFLALYGKNCLEKTIPSCVKHGSSRQINLFLKNFLEGDGYKKGNRNIYYTSSKKISDVLQELIFKVGCQSTVCVRKLEGKTSWIKDHYGTSSNDGYVVSQSFENSDGCLRTKHLRKEDYKGFVHCVTLEKHGLLFTRRNGVCMWSGNSAIPDIIWETAEGAMTDENTQIIWVALGNPTRNSGRFHGCFHGYRHRWVGRHVDSRTCRFTNKSQIEKWVADYGEDSDFVRIHVRGVFPHASSKQFIPGDIVEMARGKHLREEQYNFAPVIIGVDPAWEGGDETVIALRQGLMGKILKRFPKNSDDVDMAGIVARLEDEYKADAVFIDLGYGTGIYSAGKHMGRKWMLVPFGSKSSNDGFLNKRAEMWNSMKEWLQSGGAIPNDPILCSDLTNVEARVGELGPNCGKVYLEPKESMRARGLASPGSADALCLTFAFPVRSKMQRGFQAQMDIAQPYDPLSLQIKNTESRFDPLSLTIGRLN